MLYSNLCKSQHKYLDDKHGGFKYFEFSINSWKYWCKKNNVELFIYDTPSDSEHVNHKPIGDGLMCLNN